MINYRIGQYDGAAPHQSFILIYTIEFSMYFSSRAWFWFEFDSLYKMNIFVCGDDTKVVSTRTKLGISTSSRK